MDDREESNMEQPELFKFKPPKTRKRKEPQEYKVTPLRECPVPEKMHVCETPEHDADYSRTPVTTVQRTEPHSPVRTLKIEEEGDQWKGVIKPKIRLMGRWLERAGFSPGNHVHVTCVAPGVIELRSPDPLLANETMQPSSEEPF